MKKILTGLVIFVIILVSSCASSDPGYINQPSEYANYSSLAEALRSVGGVRVTGANTLVGDPSNVSVFLRGASSSIILTNQPLYVVNNVPVGNNYNDANSIVNMREVTSIRILSGTYAVTRWGEQGNSGVIMIKMKEASDIR
jgi:outer membrane receptor for ferrienterochelin and colicin